MSGPAPRPSTDMLKRGRPVGGYKQDFNLYTGAGSGGAGLLTTAGVQRYSYMLDLSPFDVFIREIMYQNASFQVFLDSGGATSEPLYFNVYGSNDYPTSNIIAEAPAKGLKFTTAPPYNIDLRALNFAPVTFDQKIVVNELPSSVNIYTDQGAYIYDKASAYSGVVSGKTFGNNNKLVQPFVPATSRLIRFDLGLIGLVNGLNFSDHTIYSDLVVEIWDYNKSVIFSETISRFANPKPGSTKRLPVPFVATEFDQVADDGKNYWTSLYQVKFEPATPLQLVVGQTYYICVRTATQLAANNWVVQSNINGAFNTDTTNLGQYINGNFSFASFAGTSLTQMTDGLGNPLQAVFCTMRDTPRLAINVAWDSSAYYWFNPATNFNQIKVLKVDADRRI